MPSPSQSKPQSKPQGKPQYSVGSVARALVLLDVIADGPPAGLTVSEISRHLSISKSSAYALTQTLVSGAFLQMIDPGPRYQLGLALVRLGDVAAERSPLGALVRPVLHELTAQTGLTTRVAINQGGRPMFVDRVDSPGAVRFHTPLGVPELAHVSSAGKAILAELPTSAVRAVVEEFGLPRRTPKTIVDLDHLLNELDVTRQRGFAIDDEEDFEGVFCIGAAFFDHSGTCSGAISATGIKRELTTGEVDALGRSVLRAADRVTGLLRGQTPRSRTTSSGPASQ